MINITAKEKPRWYQLRWKLSNFFMFIARKIYPENPEVTAFYIQQMQDLMITGNVITRIVPDEHIRTRVNKPENVYFRSILDSINTKENVKKDTQ